MNRKCWRLQSHDVWLGLPVDKLFSTYKQANQYFRCYCMGTGITTKVRAIDETRKFYPSMDVLDTTKCRILGKNEK